MKFNYLLNLFMKSGCERLRVKVDNELYTNDWLDVYADYGTLFSNPKQLFYIIPGLNKKKFSFSHDVKGFTIYEL